ncbi:MAG: hypothetical protein H8E90_01235 [Anaerolineales bacterium]|nr:hypothetical protein [Anaerolineales bacterium]
MSEEELIEPKVNPNPAWKVNTKARRSACDNRPGLKKIYVKVLDDKGEPLSGIKVRFDVEPSQGIAYDHPNVWGDRRERVLGVEPPGRAHPLHALDGG